MQSCLYVGRLRHRRLAPKPHAFSYNLFMVYLDLSELESVFRGHWLWSVGRRNLAWFNRADYLGDPALPLDEAVRHLVEQRTGQRPSGPIRMLTHLRSFGYCFNPVTFYYCFGRAGQAVETIVAEITNTPWNERYSYVLGRDRDQGVAPVHRYCFAKDFHVSPFFPMDMEYDWRFCEPGSRLSVHMKLAQNGHKAFDATLNLTRWEITSYSLAIALIRFPCITLKVIAAIYWQAAMLKLKRIPFFDHPSPTREKLS
jgi:hypothetical protein